MPDLKLKCRDCGAEFSFSDAEQDYFKAQGFTSPKRCLPCRARNRKNPPGAAPRAAVGSAADASANGTGDSAAARVATEMPPRRIAVRRVAGPPPAALGENGRAHPASVGASGPPAGILAGGDAPLRPTFAAVCSLCSAETQVPFRPDGVRPVFCLACLKRRTR